MQNIEWQKQLFTGVLYCGYSEKFPKTHKKKPLMESFYANFFRTRYLHKTYKWLVLKHEKNITGKKKIFYQYKKINCNMSNIATYTLPVFSIQHVMTMRNVYIIKIFEVCWHFTVLRSSNGLETFLIWLFPCYLYWVFKLFASSTFVTAYFWFVFQILIHVMQRKKM